MVPLVRPISTESLPADSHQQRHRFNHARLPLLACAISRYPSCSWTVSQCRVQRICRGRSSDDVRLSVEDNLEQAIRNKSTLYSRSQFDLRDWFGQSHSSLTDHLCYVLRFHSSAKREVSTAYARHEYESVKPSSRYRRISLSVDSMPRRYDSKRARATPDEPEMTSQIIWLICVGCPTIYDRPYS
nr:hypothetical protein CFP56_75983 [Quercus suber]